MQTVAQPESARKFGPDFICPGCGNVASRCTCAGGRRQPLASYFAAEPIATDRCQCGQWCGKATACQPAQGQVHQPFYTVRQMGKQYTAILVDPQDGVIYTLNRRMRKSPCDAAWDAVRWSTDTRNNFPVRLDKAADYCEAKVNWSSISDEIAGKLYQKGVDLYTEWGGRRDRMGYMPIESLLWHPLSLAGWDDMEDSTEAVFAEADSLFRVTVYEAVAA